MNDSEKIRVNGTIVITDPCYIESDSVNTILSTSTIYGDWTCFTYKGSERNDELINKWWKTYLDSFKQFNSSEISPEEKHNKIFPQYNGEREKFLKEYCYGEFTADSGQVCVVLLDEALKADPSFEGFIKDYPHTATVIEDFDGYIYTNIRKAVNSIGNEYDELHIIGEGNKPFYTQQCGF